MSEVQGASDPNVPPNPGGWIVTTAKRKALDKLRRESTRGVRETRAVDEENRVRSTRFVRRTDIAEVRADADAGGV